MGIYPDPPGRKFDYDIDGSVVFSIDESGTVTQITGSALTSLNDETNTGAVGSGGTGSLYLGILFPQLRSISGYYINFELNWSGSVSRGNVETSSDSSSGLDGTWTERVAAPFTLGGQEWFANSGTGLNPKPTFRIAVASLVVASCKAIRFRLDSSLARNKYFNNMHVYGDIVSGETPDRLRLWHPTLNQEVDAAYFNLNEVQRSSVVSKTFRVKNNSSGLTANNIVVSSEALTESSPTIVGVTDFDNAGSGYSSTQNIGNLAPGAISGVITLRISPGSSHPLSLWRQRLKAVAGSWT